MLSRAIRHGRLTVTGPNGRSHQHGDGTGPEIAIRITDAATANRLFLNPDLELGEAYMHGRLLIEKGSLAGFIELLFANLDGQPMPFMVRLIMRARLLLRRLEQHNPVGRAQANVAHHYDLPPSLYEIFLDSDRQYSCAYFENPQMGLEEAQLAKKRHIAAKLAIKPGMRVLDIGCGWGGMGLYLARHCGAEVTGVTLSAEQHLIANARAAAAGANARFLLTDYRALEGQFDRIVSVGMFEHVGLGHFREFFAKTRQLLAPDGVMLLHSINRADGLGVTSSFIAKYIFPGGYIPALSEVLPAIERAGLYVTDIEILRLHYAETLKIWRERFMAGREKALAINDEAFARMWEFYLASSEMSFRHSGLNNFQIQLATGRHSLPLTRAYMMEEEERLRRSESALAAPQEATA